MTTKLFSNLVNYVKEYAQEADFTHYDTDLVLAYGKTLSKDEFNKLITICEAHTV